MVGVMARRFTAPRYAAVGEISGHCGHAHRTIAGARRCLWRMEREVQRLPGGNANHTDLEVRRHDGGALNRPEREELAQLDSWA